MDSAYQPIEELKQGDRKVRRRAARALGNYTDPRAIASLIEALRDKNALVPVKTRDVLVNTGGPAGQAPIGALGTETRWSHVHDALVRTGGPAIQALIAALERQSLKDAAAFVLSRLGRQAMKPLVESLVRPEIRQDVASTLNLEARLYRAPAEEALLKALTIPAYRAGVLMALRHIITPDLPGRLPLLLSALGILQKRHLMDAVAEGIATFILPVVHLLGKPCRHEASALLCMIGIPATPRLVNVIKDRTKSEQARLGTVHILGEIGDPGATEVLVKALQDENSLVSLQAAESPGRTADRRAFRPLLSVLSSGRTGLREKAIEAFRSDSSLTHAFAGYNRKAGMFFCAKCLCRFDKHMVESVSRHSLSFFSCRKCRGVSHIMEDIEGVVARLDANWSNHVFDDAELLGSFGYRSASGPHATWSAQRNTIRQLAKA